VGKSHTKTALSARIPFWVLEEKVQLFGGQVKSLSQTLKSYVQRTFKWEEEKDLTILSSNELQVLRLPLILLELPQVSNTWSI